jgi:hypothetical protein
MKLTINLDELVKLTKDGSKIVLDPSAEESIIKLLKLQAKVETAIEKLKEEIASEGLKYDPNFKSVESDNLRIWYKYYGSRYAIDANRISEIPESLYKEQKRYYPDTKAIDEYTAQGDKDLPLGIIERERAKKLSIQSKVELDEQI